MLSRVLICIPTYNESENIVDVLQRFERVIEELKRDFAIEILVIDDNSPDGTSSLVKSLNLPNVSVLDRPGKGGLGPAYLAGFSWGLKEEFSIFVECDADASHQPEELPRLLGALPGSELVIGTRWMAGGKVENWPFTRRLISRAGTKYAQIMLRLPYRDLTGGYRVLTRNCLDQINFMTIESIGYGFQIEIAMRAHDAGLVISQAPISFIERTKGRSKMSRKIVLEALIQTTKWSLQRVAKPR